MVQKKQLLTIFLGIFFAGLVSAQTSADNEYLMYTVQPGDTLYELSQTYLNDPKHWPGIAKDGKIAVPERLQPGKVIRLPVDLLRHENKEIRVAFSRGDAQLVENKTTKKLIRGMVLTEGHIIQTGSDGFVSLALPDDSKLFLSASSKLRITHSRFVPDVNKDLIEFVLEQGNVESQVAPQKPSARFRVGTPLSVTGVRGTQFGVSFDSKTQEQTNNVTQGAVQVYPRTGKLVHRDSKDAVFLSAGQGAVMSARMSRPSVNELLPAPDLSGWPKYVHTTTWTPNSITVKSASGYVVQVSPLDHPERVVYESRGELKPIGPITEDGTYISYVRALDANLVPGKVSVHTFHVKSNPIAPLLQAPRNNAKLMMESQQLECTNVPGVNRYYLQVAQDEQFTKIVDEQETTKTCLFAFTPPEAGSYFWRTASLDRTSKDINEARGEYSSVGRFSVVPRPLAPQASQQQNDDGVILQWAAVAPNNTYVVQVSDRMDFADILLTQETTQTQVTLDMKYSCKTLYVRLQSKGTDGIESSFSKPRVLQTTYAWCTSEGVPIVDAQGVPVLMN